MAWHVAYLGKCSVCAERDHSLFSCWVWPINISKPSLFLQLVDMFYKCQQVKLINSVKILYTLLVFYLFHQLLREVVEIIHSNCEFTYFSSSLLILLHQLGSSATSCILPWDSLAFLMSWLLLPRNVPLFQCNVFCPRLYLVDTKIAMLTFTLSVFVCVFFPFLYIS